MELDMEEAFNTGTPLRCIPACIVSSLRDFSFWLLGRCLGGWVGDAPTEFYKE